MGFFDVKVYFLIVTRFKSGGHSGSGLNIDEFKRIDAGLSGPWEWKEESRTRASLARGMDSALDKVVSGHWKMLLEREDIKTMKLG